MVEVVVEHDYQATASDELTIKKGDIIRDVVMNPGGWWEGVLNNKRGMFPSNFVRIEQDSSGMHHKSKNATGVYRCRVVYNYTQSAEDELTLCVGDVIDVLGEEEEGWWRGVLRGKDGVFPSNFVEKISSPKARKYDTYHGDITDEFLDTKMPNLPPKPAKTYCEVKYAYKAQNEDELTLTEGDIITLVSKEVVDPGWWKGELNGRIGMFPDNFVVIVPQPPPEKLLKEETPAMKVVNEQIPLKPSAIASQRNSLDVKTEPTENKCSPPVPGKKPTMVIKKSPTSSSGGLFSGLKKKVLDAVDGSASSKAHSGEKMELKMEKNIDNAFDQVERNALLQDVRATRPKGPGRRPPTNISKEGVSDLMNGNTEHVLDLDTITENFNILDTDSQEVKPKVREWEKHKAPWLEEMKLNQAKRTSPGPEQNRIKNLELDDIKSTKSHFETDTSPVDMSKSMPSLSSKLKTPPNELERNLIPVLRNKTSSQSTSTRAHAASMSAMSASSDETKVRATQSMSSKISPNFEHNNKSPVQKTPDLNDVKSDDIKGDYLTDMAYKFYTTLLQRIQKLEALVESQNRNHQAALEDLQCQLQEEINKRVMMQTKLDKLSHSVQHL